MSLKATFEIKSPTRPFLTVTQDCDVRLPASPVAFYGPSNATKGKAENVPAKEKDLNFCCCFKKQIFFLRNVFFPLDENTEEAGVAEFTD